MKTAVYIAETSPPSIRGRLVGVFEILSQGGGMLVCSPEALLSYTCPF